MLVRIANREDLDQTASKLSDLGLRSLSKFFGRQLVLEILELLPYSQMSDLINILILKVYLPIN